MRRIIMDSDMLGDDALAILLAKNSEEVKLEAVTTVSGSCDIDETSKNTLKILELADLNIPVAAGMGRPLFRNRPDGCRECVVCFNDLPEPRGKIVKEHAVDLIISKVMKSPKEITLVPTGPLTNIGMAVLQEPRIVENVKEVILMGGAATLPVAEFNIRTDPEAAKIVFDAGWPVTMVGLDVTQKTLMMPEELSKIRFMNTSVEKLATCVTRSCIDRVLIRRGFNGFIMHDPLAMGVTIDKSLVKTKRVHIDVETKGEHTSGQTIADFGGRTERERRVDVCLEVDSKRFMDLFIQRIFGK